MPARSILITGASSGIGAAAARRLHARGWHVFATARRQEDLDTLTRSGVTAIAMEMTDAGSITAGLAAVLAATGGRLDALFNNAGFGQPGAVEDLPTAVLRAQFETNLFGWHELTRQVVPIMRRQGGGRIVQCSSVLGIAALKYRGAYAASKFALEGLTDCLRLEVQDAGISVSTLRPGPIATRFVPRSLAALRDGIALAASPHAAIYARRIARMERGGAGRFKLPPDAVIEKLIHALESPRPRPYYSITVPSRIMAWARRLLPDRWLVRFLAASSDRET